MFYLFSAGVAAASVVWLRQEGRERSRLAQALLAIIVWDLLWLLITQFLDFLGESWQATLHSLIQVLAWAVLLWGLNLKWRTVAAASLVATVLAVALPEPVGNILDWGFLTALPFAAAVTIRQRTVNVPFLPPLRQVAPLKRARTVGSMSREIIETQRPILECLAEGVIVSNQDGVIDFANQAAVALIGDGAEGIEGQQNTEVLARLFVPTSTDEFNRVQFEMKGRIIQGQLNLVYDKSGAVQGTVAVLRDITAEYQAERTKTAFVTTVSHELRTPLTAIKGYVELLQGGTAGEMNQNQRLFLGTIQRNVTRMVQLINSLIFASALKGGRLEFKAGHADLRQLIQQIIREMADAALQNDQKFVVDIDSRLQPIHADPIHMSTILQELVSNSLKYNRPGGEVRISVALESEIDREQEFALVSVSDNGIGIDPADQVHIFEEFYRPDRHETQVRAGGIGVGLSIVRALVEAYNGRIWFESTLGQGSTFTFIIPTRQPVTVTQLWPAQE
ncbi:MAG: cell wall metabolism sensor histidine kinase WalK [Chloroflexi bacterium]|nr:cell wall metabolism sensor histidine kinase WalK [Chloroflexota bacterium]MCI0576292.1 cell wall metabolism sensor histidine kinase WalK [Chloroflexota bacterium]MCI0644512.1 cell wall metabolism sensor histidine kinase WalK [Chloroflexota bacterium]MCI0728799.1 cell wall metabolism sensor histidine kinase WalK [Chloroflexota bacterium]